MKMYCFGDKASSLHCKIVLLDEQQLVHEVHVSRQSFIMSTFLFNSHSRMLRVFFVTNSFKTMFLLVLSMPLSGNERVVAPQISEIFSLKKVNSWTLTSGYHPKKSCCSNKNNYPRKKSHKSLLQRCKIAL